MSKLSKAPLLEVIFEINWDITNNNDIAKFQYLHGDLYSILKSEYPKRENLVPSEVPIDIMKNRAMFRFRKEDGYPLVQVGPGILTLNTTDELYFWNDYRKEITKVTNSLSEVFPEISQTNLFLTLTYLDFFEIDTETENVIEYINQNLNLNVNQTFIENENTKEVNLALSYKINDDTLLLNLRNGIVNNNKKGVILQTKLIGTKKKYSNEEQLNWLNKAHETCSDIFKKITTEDFYNSFK